ncbi:hypothetical protein SS17_5303 [Escherichia coli O157:H7 str. SS17]|nr:hypothetical protein SS17_5303 [Escherichia coli O157:H7 str. SS17]
MNVYLFMISTCDPDVLIKNLKFSLTETFVLFHLIFRINPFFVSNLSASLVWSGNSYTS